MISIIISTYNRPDALALVLLALEAQDVRDFEVIIGDDGSSDETRLIIEHIKTKINYPIKHIWQEHDGFRAAMSRNKSVASVSGDYLLFLDGDCIPQVSFVRRHKELAKEGYFVVGNRVLLSPEFTKKLLQENLPIYRWQNWNWFIGFLAGWNNRFLPSLSLGKFCPRYLRRARWQGAKTCNLGVWKKDFVAINGFDESYHGWGYEDSDLVVRLIHNKIYRKDGHFAIPVFHLWHMANNRNREDFNYKKLKAVVHDN
jgi:glycosyltransferase involved in cell wall biosynthesis